MNAKEIAKGPKLNAEGKKDWKGFVNAMTDQQAVEYAAKSLQGSCMVHQKTIGARIAKVKVVSK